MLYKRRFSEFPDIPRIRCFQPLAGIKLHARTAIRRNARAEDMLGTVGGTPPFRNKGLAEDGTINGFFSHAPIVPDMIAPRCSRECNHRGMGKRLFNVDHSTLTHHRQARQFHFDSAFIQCFFHLSLLSSKTRPYWRQVDISCWAFPSDRLHVPGGATHVFALLRDSQPVACPLARVPEPHRPGSHRTPIAR